MTDGQAVIAPRHRLRQRRGVSERFGGDHALDQLNDPPRDGVDNVRKSLTSPPLYEAIPESATWFVAAQSSRSGRPGSSAPSRAMRARRRLHLCGCQRDRRLRVPGSASRHAGHSRPSRGPRSSTSSGFAGARRDWPNDRLTLYLMGLGDRYTEIIGDHRRHLRRRQIAGSPKAGAPSASSNASARTRASFGSGATAAAGRFAGGHAVRRILFMSEMTSPASRDGATASAAQ